MRMQMKKVWIDGACFPNPGAGGWAWTTLDGEEDRGGLNPATNQIMELTAAIKAIEYLGPKHGSLLIISDSQYVIKGATEWMQGWIRNSWRTSKGDPVANQSLWHQIDSLQKIYEIKYQWVKGHSGDPGNEEADRLATLGSGILI